MACTIKRNAVIDNKRVKLGTLYLTRENLRVVLGIVVNFKLDNFDS